MVSNKYSVDSGQISRRKVAYPDGKTPNICIIGAGFSGLTAGIQLKRKLNLESFTIYDENHDIGGTWLMNTYPGAACDIPSHYYSLSFELNPDWTEAYSSSSEILQYMKKLSAKYGLSPHITLNTEVRATVWNESAKSWNVTLYDKRTSTQSVVPFDIIITGVGLLRSPSIPDDLQGFKGPVIHTAQWDHSVNISDKVVGIVGSGSSAIQIVPAIADTVKELHCYQRKPAHVAERPQKTYSNNWKVACKYFPPLMWLTRVFIFIQFEVFHWGFFPGSWFAKYMKSVCKKHRKTQIKSTELQQMLIPRFEYGCKRVLFHSEYYPALELPNVTVHTGKIAEIKGNQVDSTDGSSTKLDVLILATGFKTQGYLDPLQIVGRDGVEVNDLWKKEKPSAYLGIMTHSAPNQFLILGPNTLLGHSSVLYIMECQVNYTVEAIRTMMSKDLRVLQPKKPVEEKYMKEIEKHLSKLVWNTGKCDSWYTDSKGNVTALWPYNCLTYWNRTRTFNLKDYEAC